MVGAVDEVLRVGAGFATGAGASAGSTVGGSTINAIKSGVLYIATNDAQRARLAGTHQSMLRWGNDDAVLLDAAETSARINVEGARGAVFDPHTARIQPAALVVGLARAVEQLGVPIYENTAVVGIEPGAARTTRGVVRARNVIRCTEGFTAGLPGERRTWLPMNSSLIVTEPLAESAWDEIGWAGMELCGDEAHAYIYAQRTADGRIALGGRGNPYRYGSRTDRDGATPSGTVAALRETLTRLFPALRGVGIAAAWSGVLGVPRDWCAEIAFDPGTGLGYAGGYTGHGVATSNLAGRTLRDLVLGRQSELTGLPHVGWRGRRWEPEPARWIGVHGMYAAYRYADRAEDRASRSGGSGGSTSRVAAAADRISGRL
jgi:glycine/D-amino acid oxidase-like deaminating enzyme